MSNLSYLEPHHVVQKYLKKGSQFFYENFMRSGWFGFYEPHGEPGDKIPADACHSYNYNDKSAPINFVILNKNITGVGENAFKDRKDILLFDAGSCEGLTIEQNALKGCESLYKAALPYEIESIDKTAFYGCESLSVVEIARGKSYDGREIPRENRHLYVPLRYDVVIIGGYPYIYDQETAFENGERDVFKVQKLAVKDGKWPEPIICAEGSVSFNYMKGCHWFKIYGLGHTEETARKNLENEKAAIESAVKALAESRAISGEKICQALDLFKQK
jgi:hypothetical protein